MKDLEEEFNNYFNAVEGFHLRSERFYDDVTVKISNDEKIELMREWLKQAFIEGAKLYDDIHKSKK